MPEKHTRHRLLFIVQRFGIDIDGGAELYCRWLATHLKKHYSIDVLTTCATSYITWENVFEPGESESDGLKIIRCQVSRTRDIHSFNELTQQILSNPHTDQDEENWLDAQGPFSPDLIRYLDRHGADYRCLIFFTYLYHPTVAGTRVHPSRSIMIPTAHDEPVAHLGLYQRLYDRVAGLLFLTHAEQEFVEQQYQASAPRTYLGTGIEIPDSSMTPHEFLSRYRIRKPMILYVGRVEEGKGCLDAAKNFSNYCDETGFNGTLVFAGKTHMKQVETDRVRFIGYIPDGELRSALEASDIILVPSPFESLSILLLQAFASSKPVLVNAHCAVLKDHCLRSNGGLFYDNPREFHAALDLLIHRRDLREKMGLNGHKYVLDHFGWDRVQSRFQSFLDTHFPL